MRIIEEISHVPRRGKPRILDLPLRGMKAKVKYHSHAALRLATTILMVFGAGVPLRGMKATERISQA